MFKKFNLILGGRSIAILIFLFVFFNVMLKQTISAELVLDLKFGYTASDAYQVLQEMGQEQREAYLRCLLLFDIPYMVIYTLLFIQLFNFLWKEKGFQLFCLGILVFDLLENFMILMMIQTFPDYSSFLGFSASFFTSAKWVLVGVAVVLCLVGVFKKIFSNQRQGLL